jgi:hypothetical protein
MCPSTVRMTRPVGVVSTIKQAVSCPLVNLRTDGKETIRLCCDSPPCRFESARPIHIGRSVKPDVRPRQPGQSYNYSHPRPETSSKRHELPRLAVSKQPGKSSPAGTRGRLTDIGHGAVKGTPGRSTNGFFRTSIRVA